MKRKQRNKCVPEVVHVGGEAEEDLVDARHVPQRSHEQQVHQVALAQKTTIHKWNSKIKCEQREGSGVAHVSMRSKRMVLKFTLQARKCSYRLAGLMVFRNSARKPML